jgi:hypothetical protein
MALVRALFTSHVSETLQIIEGELWDADDPIVRANPSWFSSDLSPVIHHSTPPVVRTADAEPGERRATQARVKAI